MKRLSNLVSVFCQSFKSWPLFGTDHAAHHAKCPFPIIIVCLLLCAGNVIAQETQKISYNRQDYAVISLTSGKTVYISLPDLAAKLHIQSFNNAEKKKIELRFQKLSLIFTANNPFLIVRSRENTSVKTIQMASQALLVKNTLYAPLRITMVMLHDELSMNIAWNEKESGPLANESSVKETEEEKVEGPSSFTYTVNEKANGTLISFNSKQKIKKYTSSVKDNDITVEFQGVKLGAVPKTFTTRKGAVKSIEWKQEKNSAVVLIKMSEEPAGHEFIEESDKTLLLTIHNQKFTKKKTESDPARQKWKFDVLVIDAGHGGKDYGAIGVHNLIEKQINLGVALKLGKLVQQNMKDVKVVFTRKDDTFIELYKRGKIANENNGKLFISIHCNSVQAKVGGPNGYEIYLLRPGRTAEAINIAERENSVISYEDKPSRYGKLTDENFILVSMAHSSYMRYSEKFAEILDGHLRNGSKIASRGIKQAGFYVLVGAAMPSILFETGYVTNESDAAYMRSDEGQKEIAGSIFQAIKSFKSYYAKEIESE
jgi:N-acetylmuramoyl-L-alanine amidase